MDLLESLGLVLAKASLTNQHSSRLVVQILNQHIPASHPLALRVSAQSCYRGCWPTLIPLQWYRTVNRVAFAGDNHAFHSRIFHYNSREETDEQERMLNYLHCES